MLCEKKEMPIQTRKVPEVLDESWLENDLWLESGVVDKNVIRVWSKEIDGFKLDLEWLVKGSELILGYIDGKYVNNNTRRSHYRVYMKLLKGCPEKLMMRVKSLWLLETENVSKSVGASEFSDVRRENFIDEMELIKYRSELRSKWDSDPYDNKLNIQHLMLCLYTMHPPLRGEWLDMLIWYGSGDPPSSVGKKLVKENYLYGGCKKWRVLLNNDKQISLKYKTSGEYKYSELELDLPLFKKISCSNESLCDVIDKSLKYYPREYVLSSITVSTSPLSDGFRRQMLYIFGKKVGIDILRQAYVNYVAHKLDLSYNDRLLIANNMRHNLVTSDKHYKKLESEVKTAD